MNYAAGSNLFSVAVGDFNGDGPADLAVADAGGGRVSVLLGNGDGTFQTAVNYFTAPGSFPLSVAVGDFNTDGHPDLAVANDDGTVSVLLGNGDGTFQASVQYVTGAPADSVAVGDFNGDGHPDLAPWRHVARVSVLLGIGDGTFPASVKYAAGASPDSVGVGVFNRDGHADLAVANDSSGNVSVLLGNGDGSIPGSGVLPGRWHSRFGRGRGLQRGWHAGLGGGER